MIKVSVAKDFTKYPSGRYKKNGNTSGEEFREKLLEPALKSGQQIEVFLDGTIGYGSSFLEEAFGGLVRNLGFSAEELFNKIKFVSEDQLLIQEIKEYISEADQEKK